MELLIIFIALVSIGRLSTIYKKKALHEISTKDPMIIIWCITILWALCLTIYIYPKRNQIQDMFAMERKEWMLWVVISTGLGLLSAFIGTPLLKKLDYSLYTAIIAPLSMVVAIIWSTFLLHEKTTQNIYISIILYLFAA